ncbi:HNH endonuclease [Nonomuraea sp. NPDC049714]|uniref:HNH endonuclease n=1 Tax=Nonomuraea sp. NPDC049714 TaxID=3364357 RepID=UPI003789C95C
MPSAAQRFRFCSSSCAAQAIQGAKRGLPGMPWTVEQRAKVSATLAQKYRNEWTWKSARQSAQMTGAGNPAWKGGARLKGYTPGFTPRLKQQIAQRDQHVCRLCGAPRGSGTHAVHHIDGEKHDHSASNLVLLCISCHSKVHHHNLPIPPATD